MNGESILIEDLELITMIPKTQSFEQDIKEVLEFVVEDLTAIFSGKKQ